MHDVHLEFELTQTCGSFTGQETPANNYDRLLQLSHFAQGEAIADCSQVNNVSQPHSRTRWLGRATSHRQAGLIKFNRFAIPENRQPTVDIQLRDYSAEPSFDLMGLIPVGVQVRELF